MLCLPAPPRQFRLLVTRAPAGTNISCMTDSVYPEPRLRLVAGGRERAGRSATAWARGAGYSQATTALLPASLAGEVRCELRLPGTPYQRTLTRQLGRTAGADTNTTCLPLLVIVILSML